MLTMNNLATRIEAYKARIQAATERVLNSGHLILGPELRAFEQAFAEYVGVQHGIGVGNGTDAIELALRALGVGAGDRVATVANAGMYTTTALLAIGAKPFFLDVDTVSHTTTLAEVERAVASQVKAVVVTHLYGQIAPATGEIAACCRRHGIPLLEDCAQAHGARLDGQRAGSFGDAASFSFYPTKNLGALGDGGAVLTNDPAIAERVLCLRQYGWTSKYTVELAGARNSRLDEWQAAILSVFLPDLDTTNARRRAIATRYTQALQHPEVTTPPLRGEDYVAHLYVVRTRHRDALRLHLQACGIPSDVHYPVPDHQQAILRHCSDVPALPNTEKLSKEILTLPCYPDMQETDILRVINAVNGWNANADRTLR